MYTVLQQNGRCGSTPVHVTQWAGLIIFPGLVWSMGFSLIFVFAMFLLAVNLLAKLMAIGKMYARDDALPYRLHRMLSPGLAKQLKRDMEVHRCGHFSHVWLWLFSCVFLVTTQCCLTVKSIQSSNDQAWGKTLAGWGFLCLMGVWARWTVAFVSYHFMALARAVAGLVEDLAIWEFSSMPDPERGNEREQLVTVDLSSAFANYNVMVNVVSHFAAAYSKFFFFAESWLFLTTVAQVVAAWFEVSLAIAATTPSITRAASVSTIDRVIAVTRAGTAVSLGAYLSYTLIMLFWQAATLTQACTEVTTRAHSMVGFLEHIGDENAVQKSVDFLKHVERGELRFGFRSMGITISKSLILKSVYVVGTLLSTGLLLVLRYYSMGENASGSGGGLGVELFAGRNSSHVSHVNWLLYSIMQLIHW